MTETIAPFTVCLLTPLGSGGLAAVRLFGPGASVALERMFQPDRPPMSGQAGRLALGWVIDPANGERIDQAMARFLPGRLGAELTLHGGVRIVQRVLAACQSLGGRRLDSAEPAGGRGQAAEIPSPLPSPSGGGEISNTGGQAASGTRAEIPSPWPFEGPRGGGEIEDELWHQSLELARADHVPRPALWADLELTLPLARTRAITDWLIGQYSAGLADAIESIVAGRWSVEQGDALLDRLVAESAGFRRAVTGLRAAIVGPTNAGKSSLFNALAGAEGAIVSEQPGTTRDYVTRWASVGGLAVELIDTAGLRGQPSELESRASELAAPVVRSADVRLIVLDGTQPADAILELSGTGSLPASVPTGRQAARATHRISCEALLDEFARIGPVIWVVNKCDQPSELQAEGIVEKFGGGAIVHVSALTGAGLPELAAAMRTEFGIADLAPESPGVFTNRQLELVSAARRAVGEQRNEILTGILDS